MLAEMTELRTKDPNFNKFASLRKKYGWQARYPDGKLDYRVRNFFTNHRRSNEVINRSNALRNKKNGVHPTPPHPSPLTPHPTSHLPPHPSPTPPLTHCSAGSLC